MWSAGWEMKPVGPAGTGSMALMTLNFQKCPGKWPGDILDPYLLVLEGHYEIRAECDLEPLSECYLGLQPALVAELSAGKCLLQ